MFIQLVIDVVQTLVHDGENNFIRIVCFLHFHFEEFDVLQEQAVVICDPV